MIGVEATAMSTPHKAAIVVDDERIDYATLNARVARATTVLEAVLPGAGRPVALAVRNRPEFFEIALAAARLGVDVVPVPWRSKLDDVRYMVDDSDAALLVAEEENPIWGPALTLREYRAARDAAELSSRPAKPPVFRSYTSGTSGRPKAVLRARSEPAAAIERARALCDRFGVAGSEHVHLACGPLYHTAPLAYAHYALLFGQTVVLMPRFDPRRALEQIQAERVSWTHMVPINFIRILALHDASTFDLSSLRRVLHAAAPCPPDVKRRIMALFPAGVVWEYYGATEGMATLITADEWMAKPGSVGRAWPETAIEIRDAEGALCPPGRTGVVWVKGNRFRYGGDEAKTAEAWRGGFFSVGDMGYLDEDGFLFLTDRAHDLIITGGANVYPAEVEAVLFAHPAVADCAVFGIPDEEFGEAVHAVVEPRGPLDAASLIAFVRERLAHYRCPRSVELVASLPRDDNGKVAKRAMRDRYWDGRGRTI